MRGEDKNAVNNRAAIPGSPPHARGRLPRVHVADIWGRITPACAGKTARNRQRRCESPDHPRMRGEDRPEQYVTQLSRGSPPHARGRLDLGFGEFNFHRITPACAGKTYRRLSGRISRTDHPRMRGEDLKLPRLLTSQFGSPPHARGRLKFELQSYDPMRITPACAGKTDATLASRTQMSDHPRMRGEDASATSARSE